MNRRKVYHWILWLRVWQRSPQCATRCFRLRMQFAHTIFAELVSAKLYFPNFSVTYVSLCVEWTSSWRLHELERWTEVWKSKESRRVEWQARSSSHRRPECRGTRALPRQPSARARWLLGFCYTTICTRSAGSTNTPLSLFAFFSNFRARLFFTSFCFYCILYSWLKIKLPILDYSPNPILNFLIWLCWSWFRIESSQQIWCR